MDIIIAVETHLNQQRSESETDKWGRKGRSAQFAPGQVIESIDDENGLAYDRPRGGALMMTRTHLRVEDMSTVLADLGTEDLVAQVLRTQRGPVLGCGGYLRPGAGLRGVNCVRMQKLAGVVGAWNGPVVCVL